MIAKSTKTSLVMVAAAAAMALSMAAVQNAEAAGAKEKCYGIVKAGKNDCATANSSCAGTAKADRQTDAWVYLPKGTCAKVVGGSLSSMRS